MKRVALVFAIAALVMATAVLVGCGKPSNMDQVTYDLGKEAVEIGNDYVSGAISASAAKARLDIVYSELQAHRPQEKYEIGHLLVKSDVLILTNDLVLGYDKDKFKKDLRSLKQTLS